MRTSTTPDARAPFDPRAPSREELQRRRSLLPARGPERDQLEANADGRSFPLEPHDERDLRTSRRTR